MTEGLFWVKKKHFEITAFKNTCKCKKPVEFSSLPSLHNTHILRQFAPEGPKNKAVKEQTNCVQIPIDIPNRWRRRRIRWRYLFIWHYVKVLAGAKINQPAEQK